MSSKKNESEKLKCYNITGIELFVNPEWETIIERKKIDNTFKVLHGEFFIRESLEDCQIIVSDKFLNKFISEFDLILNVVKDCFVLTKNTQETQKKLYGLEFEAELLLIVRDDGDTYLDEIPDDVELEYIFKLIE